jgi:formylglycine-generating enzyme required for sulfatase activity
MKLVLRLQHVIKVPGVNLELVLIPAGKFMMGSPKGEEERGSNETQHEVTISRPFHMGKYEVTQEQYEQIIGKNPSHFRGAKNPVECVSWDDAQEFCKKLSQKTGKAVSLPTEAQWEYACRAGTTTRFHTGETISTDQANYDGDEAYGNGQKGEYRKKTVAVGSFKPNAWGLYDMHGNVWEWCQDWYGEYPKGAVRDPDGPCNGTWRVLRGGAWYDYSRFCRSAYRSWYDSENRTDYLGFRVVVV